MKEWVEKERMVGRIDVLKKKLEGKGGKRNREGLIELEKRIGKLEVRRRGR